MPTTAKKYFFKVYIPEKHCERLLLPKAFVKWTLLQERIPEDVILKNVSGKVWCVKTRCIGEKIYLDDGWKIFREENCVGKADFLVFKYNGSNEFKVIIFELSTQIEKTLIKMEEDEEEEEENIEENAAEEDEVEEEHEDKINEEDGEDVDYDEDEDEDEDDDSDEDTEMGEESEEEHSARNLRLTSQSCRRACKREIAECSTPKAKTEEYCLEDNEFDPDIYIQPGNTYFEAKRYKNRPNQLHIPSQAIKEFSLTFPQKVTLLCCQCFKLKDVQRNELRDYHLNLSQQTPIYKKYLGVKGEMCKWQDGRVCITGWTSFCKMHKIKENNVCICEIVTRKDQTVRMFRVHVLNARRGRTQSQYK